MLLFCCSAVNNITERFLNKKKPNAAISARRANNNNVTISATFHLGPLRHGVGGHLRDRRYHLYLGKISINKTYWSVIGAVKYICCHRFVTITIDAATVKAAIVAESKEKRTPTGANKRSTRGLKALLNWNSLLLHLPFNVVYIVDWIRTSKYL